MNRIFQNKDDLIESILSITTDPIAIIDVYGLILECNLPLLDLLKYSSKNGFVGRNLFDFFIKDVNDDLIQNIRMAINSSSNKSFKIAVVDNLGSTNQVQVSLNSVRNHEGKPELLVVKIKDTAEQILNDSSVSELENLYQTLLISSADPIYIIQDDKIVMVNSAWEKLFGYSKSEVLSIEFDYFVIVAPPSQVFIKERAKQRREGIEIPPSYEFQGITRNGQIIDLEVNLTQIIWHGKTAHQGIYHDLTKNKKIEVSLRESEEKFRLIFEGTPIGIAITDLSGNFLLTNPAFQKILGYSHDELSKMNTLEITLRYESKDEGALLRKAAKENIFLKKEKHYIKKDGSLILVRFTSSVVKDQQAIPLFTIGLVEDISEQRRNDLEREVFYRISESVNTTVYLDDLLISIHNNIKKVMYAENCYIAIYEKSSQTIWYPLYVDKCDESPGREPIGKGLTAYILKTGEPFLLTPVIFEELLRKNEIEAVGMPSKSYLGVPLIIHSKVMGVLAIQSYEEENKYGEREKNLLAAIGNQAAFAIERKLAEESHKRIERRFELIWEESADGLRLTDENGIFLMVNRSFCNLVGKPREELLGKSYIIAYQSGSYGDDLLDYKKRFVNRDISRHLEVEITLWSGKKIWFEISNSFLEISDQPTLLLSIFREITQRKKLELQLLQAQTMESIGRLAGGIAHDFNNMLTAILGNAEMIASSYQKDEKASRYAGRIKQAAHRGSDLAKQLLTFARLETYNLKPIDVNEVIEETVKLIEHTFQKSVDIETDLTRNLPLINGDAGRLQQVFLNLCVNARDAMPKGGVLSIGTDISVVDDSIIEKPHEFPDGYYVHIVIADQGTGIDAKTLRKIFEPFFTTKQQGKGTGLGLAIVYGIIQNHKGFITVESILEKGTSFHIYLPLSDSQDKDKLMGNVGKITGGNETILLVDDEEIVIDIAKEMLASLNYQVIVAGSGLAAVELYKNQQNEISLIILDMAMPKMNGEEVLQMIKSINPHVKVLMASGLIEPETHKRMEIAGVSGFLPKPYNIEDLAKMVRSTLDGK